jgi:hypothetical protein
VSPASSRRLFARTPLLLVRVTPQGFLVVETDETAPELVGHAVAARPQRKLFLDGTIACQADDATHSRDGKPCEECLHPLCRPQIRLRLADRRVHYLLDLAVTSARNLLDVEERLAAQGRKLADAGLRLTVKDRGHYGEVCFETTD